MATDPLRYRADTPDAAADALLRLVRLARDGDDQFRFGPTRLADAIRDGITLSGPDLGPAIATLALVPGLAAVDH